MAILVTRPATAGGSIQAENGPKWRLITTSLGERHFEQVLRETKSKSAKFRMQWSKSPRVLGPLDRVMAISVTRAVKQWCHLVMAVVVIVSVPKAPIPLPSSPCFFQGRPTAALTAPAVGFLELMTLPRVCLCIERVIPCGVGGCGVGVGGSGWGLVVGFGGGWGGVDLADKMGEVNKMNYRHNVQISIWDADGAGGLKRRHAL